jgi:hypothetical protein
MITKSIQTDLVSAVQGRSSVTLNADLKPQGLFRLLAPLMAPVIKRQNAAAAIRLKQALDST